MALSAEPRLHSHRSPAGLNPGPQDLGAPHVHPACAPRRPTGVIPESSRRHQTFGRSRAWVSLTAAGRRAYDGQIEAPNNLSAGPPDSDPAPNDGTGEHPVLLSVVLFGPSRHPTQVSVDVALLSLAADLVASRLRDDGGEPALRNCLGCRIGEAIPVGGRGIRGVRRSRLLGRRRGRNGCLAGSGGSCLWVVVRPSRGGGGDPSCRVRRL